MDKISLTDEELILAFQNGDRDAFNLIVNRYKDKLTNFLYLRLSLYRGKKEFQDQYWIGLTQVLKINFSKKSVIRLLYKIYITLKGYYIYFINNLNP